MELNEELAGLKSQNEALRAEIASLRNAHLEETALVEEARNLITCINSYKKFILLANGQAKDKDEAEKSICVPRYKKCENCGKNLCNHGKGDYDDCDQCHDVYLASRGTHYYCPECRELFNGNKTLKEETACTCAVPAQPYTPPTIREEDRKWGLYWWDEVGVEHAMLGGKIYKRVPQGGQSVEKKE